MVRSAAEAGVAALQALYEAKARAELAAAEAILPGADAVATHGDPMACVVLVVGEPSEEERRARRALVGAPLDAAAKILTALGFDPASTLAVCARPSPGSEDRARRLEPLVEAVDPALVVALDAAAAQDLAAAFRLEPFRPGRAVGARGRVMGWVGDLGASLGDDARKRRVWAAFKGLAAATGKAADPGA
jgi:hypothetical protein